MPPWPQPPEPLPATPRDRLSWAVSVAARFGGPGVQGAGEPVFTHLPELSEALALAVAEGGRDDVAQALPLADVLGAAWERLGALEGGCARLDEALAAATRVGLTEEPAVARVLRRRARLAMALGRHDEADEDLQRAFGIAASRDDRLAVSLALDRADLAMHRGAWAAAEGLVPDLLARTHATGDPLLQAMGLNRAAWSAFGSGDLAGARERYDRAWALAELHEDPVVEARTASGLGLLAMLEGDTARSHEHWRRALELAEQLHDRSFMLHCLDGIAAVLVTGGQDADGVRLAAATTAAREALHHPRPEGMLAVHELVLRRAGAPEGAWSYAEAVTFARRAVSDAASGSP
ncbi:MAG TPA: tetratricopeptide repeat protein [Mycobacteriales bacterium]|nr:tetratricopeptide repeat protein [Mycobacteriales bacterium]